MKPHAAPLPPLAASSQDVESAHPWSQTGHSLRPSTQALRLMRQRMHREQTRYRRRSPTPPADTGQQERERLALLLHDQLGGLLVQLRLAYGAWRHTVPASSPSPGLGDPGAHFDSLLAEMASTVRHLAFSLAPPDWHEDLLSALESVAAELRLRSALLVRLDGEALRAAEAPSVPASLVAVACRIVRELGWNVHKHAAASTVHIQVGLTATHLYVVVQDDGCGLPPNATACFAKSLGLRSAQAQLRALGGSLTLRSVPGHGTGATLTLPLDAIGADA